MIRKTRRKRESCSYSPLCVYVNNTSTYSFIYFHLKFRDCNICFILSTQLNINQTVSVWRCCKGRKKVGWDRILSAGFSLPLPYLLICPKVSLFQSSGLNSLRTVAGILPVCLSGIWKVIVKRGLKWIRDLLSCSVLSPSALPEWWKKARMEVQPRSNSYLGPVTSDSHTVRRAFLAVSITVNGSTNTLRGERGRDEVRMSPQWNCQMMKLYYGQRYERLKLSHQEVWLECRTIW